MDKMNTLVLVVTYNGHSDIENCLKSIDFSKFDVMVIDNASTDNTKEIIKSKFPKVILYESDKNLGFGQANNMGLEYALEHKYDYVLLLNQDAWLEKDAIDRLLVSQRENSEYWILSPIQRHSKIKEIEPQFSTYIKKNKVDINSEVIQNVDFVNAAIWLIPITCVKRVGGFDPMFPHYGEDNDYVNRVAYWGGKIGIDPKAIGYHDRNISVQRISTEKLIYHSRLIYISKIKDMNSRNIYKGIKNAIILYFIHASKSLLKLKFRIFYARTIALFEALKMKSTIKEHKQISIRQKAFLS